VKSLVNLTSPTGRDFFDFRDVWSRQALDFAELITLAATGAAPVGLGSTGNPVFVVPASILGVPAISLPVLADGGLPLGLQLIGFADRDAALFSVAGGVLTLLR
jgi:Asp-tRNA(Asn)/Glu-tRNA(Gln) amidotransferase A subunit family amidase